MRFSLAVVLVPHCCTTVTTELAAKSNSHLCSLWEHEAQGGLTCLQAQVSAAYTTSWLGLLFFQRLSLVIHFWALPGDPLLGCLMFLAKCSSFWCWSKNHLYCFALCYVLLCSQSQWSQTPDPPGSISKVLTLQGCAPLPAIGKIWPHSHRLPIVPDHLPLR